MFNKYLKTIILLAVMLLSGCETNIKKAYNNLESGNYNLAIQLFDKALDKDPDNTDALKGKAKTLIKMSAIDTSSTKLQNAAKKLFEKVVEINPKDFESWVELGNISYRLDNSSVFLADYGNYYYSKALEIDSTQPNIWTSKGLALLLTNETESALRCFNKALTINPNLSNAWYHKGLTYYQMAVNKEKIIASKKFVQSYNKFVSNPGMSLNSFRNEAYRNLSDHDNKIDPDVINNYEQAIECFDKVIAIEPGHKKAFISKANCLKKLNKKEEAKICLQKAEKLKNLD